MIAKEEVECEGKEEEVDEEKERLQYEKTV